MRPLNPVREFNLQSLPEPPANAYDNYVKAASAIKAEPVALILDYRAKPEQDEDQMQYPLAGKIAWLGRNEVGFKLYDQAEKMEYAFPTQRFRGEEYLQPEGYETFRFLAKAVVVRNQVWSGQGQSERAGQGAIDLWKMALRIGKGAPLIPSLGATATEIYARKSLDEEIAHLNGPQAARLAKQLETILETRVPFSEIVERERDDAIFGVPRGLDQRDYDAAQLKKNEEAAAKGDTTFFFDTSPPPKNRGLVRNFESRFAMRKLNGLFNQMAGTTAVPWSKRPQAQPRSSEESSEDKLVRVIQNSRFSFVRSDVLGQIFLTRLALHAYRKDNGRYPANLNELVPKYLKAIPKDAFADGQPLRYRLDGKRYKLWSVGPDTRDDNAKPAENTRPGSTAKYFVREDSLGDMVANISR